MEEFVDLHADYILKHIPGAEDAGVKVALCSVCTTKLSDPMVDILKRRKIIDSLDSSVRLLLHIEDAWFLNENNIEELIDLKPFSVGLTWNFNNNLAGGAHEDGELTSLGKKMIERLLESGIKIDLAHLNRRSFYQVVEHIKSIKPSEALLCTHTCFDEINPHNRNLDRDQIQTIVYSGGLVGLTFVAKFLSPHKSVTMDDVYNHIKYFVDNFGDDNIAIGTDFLGAPQFPDGLDGYGGLLGLYKLLLNKGLSESTVNKIFYLNAYKHI
jgi:membrane dipeptidase